MNNYDAISILSGLIETCKDGQDGFETAAENVKNAELQSVFQGFAAQRGQFAAELQTLLSSFDGDVKDAGSIAGTLHRGWLNLKAVVTGGDEAAILSECERGEDVAKSSYGSALEKAMPANVAEVVRRQYDAILDAHQKIKALRDNAGNMTSSSATAS